MIVTVDGKLYNESLPANQTLRAVLDRIAKNAPSGQIIANVAVDGVELTGDELTTALEQPLTDGAQIELGSADVRELAADAINETAGQLETAAGALPAIAAKFESNENRDGVREFSKLLDVWRGCGDVLSQASALTKIDLTTIEHDSTTVAAHLSQLVAQLRDVKDAFETGDLVMLHDLVEYDMPELCGKWCEIMREVARSLTAKAGAPR